MTVTRQQASDFVLTADWRLDAQPEELTAIVLDRELIHRWCSVVFINCKLLERGREDGHGMAVRLHTKGFLPYCFFFEAKVVDLVPHRYLKIDVSGDFEGFAKLSVSPNASGGCDAALLWVPTVRHRYLKPFIRLFGPIIVWNHRWAMRRASRLLQAEVYRRRKASHTPDPARATFPHNLAIFRGWQIRRAEHRGRF